MGISPYIATVRQSIGNDLLLLPCVAVLPRDEQGRVLLCSCSRPTTGLLAETLGT
jgi:hypothetical protein